MSETIRAAQMKAIFPAAADDYLGQVAAELNNDLAAYGLDTPLRRAHFFAQVRQECGPGLEAAVESLAYSPTSLGATFGYYRARPAEALQDGYDRDPVSKKLRRAAAQEIIANKAYANRNGNGDFASGDGWLFRGRGFIQVTGRANYAAISAQCRKLYSGIDLDFVARPDDMKSFPGTVRSAVGFWILHNLHTLADRGGTGNDVDRITAAINPHTDSFGERRANFATALNALR